MRTMGSAKRTAGAVLATLALACSAGTAGAGAWERAAGEGFVALGQDIGGAAESAIFAEWGLGGGWTVGADGAVSLADGRDSRALGFVRRSFGTGAGRVGLELGAGLGIEDGDSAPLLRPVVSLGQGFGGPISGWAALDLSADVTHLGNSAKAVATLGLRPAPAWTTVSQLRNEDFIGEGASALSAAQSIIYELRPEMQLELGVTIGLSGDVEDRVRLGTWFGF
jgi:hypothetical protein